MRPTKGTGSAAAVVHPVPPAVGRVMARLARQVERAVDPLELSLAQYRVLGLLGEGSSPSSSLAAQLAVSPPSISSVVDGLVSRGLVERQPDPVDRRRLPLLLTAAGIALLSSADRAVADRLVEIATYLDDDIEPIVRVLEGWNRALDRHLEEQIAQTRSRSTT